MLAFLANLIHEPNPVFLKEARHSVRGLALPVLLGLELLWLVVITAFWLHGNQMNEISEAASFRVQRMKDTFYWIGLALASWLAGWSMVTLAVKRQVAERESLQSGLVFLTRVTAGQFLRGLWLAGMSGGVLPLVVTLPFWMVYCWVGRVPLSVPATCLVGQVVVMGVLLALMMTSFSAQQMGAQAKAWRRGSVLGCLVLGLWLAPSLLTLFYSLPQLRALGFPLFANLMVWLPWAVVGLLVLFYGMSWAQLTICVMPNCRAARWSRRGLQIVVVLIWLAVGLPLIRMLNQEFGAGAMLPAVAVTIMLCLFSCWKIERLGHPAKESLWISFCRTAGRLLTGRRPIEAMEVTEDAPASRTRTTMDFIERWPVFDSANPIFVKELRQMRHDLLVPVMLGVTFLSGFLGLIRTGDGCVYFNDGYQVVVFCLLALWLFIVISGLAGNSRGEAQSELRDLLFVTPLTAGQIVRGKWGAMGLAALAILLAMLPHALLGCGVQILALFFCLWMLSLLISLVLLVLALFPVSQTIFQLAGIGLVFSFFGFAQAIRHLSLWRAVLAGLLTVVMIGTLYQLAQVMARRRSGAARWLALLTLGALPVLLMVCTIMAAFNGAEDEAFFIFSSVLTLAIGLVWWVWLRTSAHPVPPAGDGQ